MKRLLVAALLLGGCATAPTERIFIGQYFNGLVVTAFQACGSSERWWVRADQAVMSALYAAAPPRGSLSDGFWLNVEVEGDLSEIGGYGHLSQYPRELHITRVITAHVGPRSCN